MHHAPLLLGQDHTKIWNNTKIFKGPEKPPQKLQKDPKEHKKQKKEKEDQGEGTP